MLINADDMPNAKRDSLNQDCNKPDHKADLYSQDGNLGVGHISGGEIKGNAKVGGKFEENNNNQSQNTNNQVKITINNTDQDSSTSKQNTLKMYLKEGDKEASIETPYSVENFQSLLGFLQQRFGDDSLEYKDIKKGSIELILKGSEKTLQSIATSFQSGELAPIVKQQFNLDIEDAKLIDSDKPENYNKNQGQKLLAFTIAGNVSQADIDILKAALVNNSDDNEEIKNADLRRLNLVRLTLVVLTLVRLTLLGLTLVVITTVVTTIVGLIFLLITLVATAIVRLIFINSCLEEKRV